MKDYIQDAPPAILILLALVLIVLPVALGAVFRSKSALLMRLSSLRLTVTLLSASMILIFVATLAQVETGIWKTQKDYFESFIVLLKYPQSLPGYDLFYWLRVPIPGGYTIGGLLMINLIAAFITRFQLKTAKIGIYAIHMGFILLLVSELMTDLLSVESQMTVAEQGRSNYSQNVRDNELIFIDRSPAEHDQVHSIPVSMLKPGKTIDVPDSPLQIKVVAYYPNSELGRGTGGQQQELATQGAGVKMNIVATPRAVTYSENTVNTATAYIEVLEDGNSLGTWLVSNVIDDRFPPQMVTAGDQSWEMALRYLRHYYPFEIELLDFSHDKYPGTNIPFNYSSKVVAHHNDSNKDQQALIYMNHPLRYEGLTFYQASFSPDETATILQVVRNPGWLLPYISVLMMGLGMCFQFGIHFSKFLKKRSA